MNKDKEIRACREQSVINGSTVIEIERSGRVTWVLACQEGFITVGRYDLNTRRLRALEDRSSSADLGELAGFQNYGKRLTVGRQEAVTIN